MMFSRGKCLMVIHLLLSEYGLCRAAPPLTHSDTLLPHRDPPGAVEQSDAQVRGSLGASPLENTDPAREEWARSARRVISQIGARLQRQIQERGHIRGNVSCQELLSASTMDDPLSSMFPRELLGLSLVPVLVVAGCPSEAQTLVLRLYDLLGAADTQELLADVQSLMERKLSRSPSPARPGMRGGAGRRIEAVMFNIQQLAVVGEEAARPEGRCDGWTRVNGTKLVGTAVEGDTGRLEEAVRGCERLGILCAGVTSGRPLTHQAVLKRGSRILPSDTSGSWIRRCSAEGRAAAATAAASRPRPRRSPERSCINRGEERVYNVVEWIPAVSTLYNLGTAVYYASMNCSQTAKERAILSAVDLGTDALMVATGGTAGVAGYALGAGVKTGVKAGVRYLLSSMKQGDDLLVNQLSWEDGVLTIQ